MADLAQNKARTSYQDRSIRRRDSILPSRRIMDAPDIRPSADMRSASRGDGGAEELLNTLRSAKGAGNSLLLRDEALNKKRDIEDGAQGALDGAAGSVDVDKLKKSLAYSSAVSIQRAQKDWFTSTEALDNKIKELVYSDEDPDPAVREAKVASLIDEHFKEFALGEDGNLKNFGSPAANRWLASQMGAFREKAGSTAYQAIENRMSEESLATQSETFRASIRAGVPMDFEENFTNLLPTVDRKAAKQAFITVIKDEAQAFKDQADALWETDPAKAQEFSTKALQLVDRLLTSKRDAVGIVPVDIPASEVAQGKPEATAVAIKASAPVQLGKPFAAWGNVRMSGKIGDARDGGKRSHNGEDFPLAVGTEITAPMGGTVSYSWSAAGGHQAFLTMDNGDKLGVAHLKSKPKEGRVEAGQMFALSGNSGKSSGPHAHMTVTSKGKKVSPTEYFNNASSVSTQELAPGEPLKDGVLNPESVSQAAEKAPLVGGVNAPKGVYSLAPSEAYELRAFKRDLKRDLDAAQEKGRSTLQTNNATAFLARMNGLGVAPTVSELREAGRTGAISIQHMDTLLNNKEAEEREARSEVRAIAAEQRAIEQETKEQRGEAYVNSVLAPLYAGRLNPTQAQEKLLKLIPTIQDRELRNMVTSQIGGSIGAVVDLRKASNEHKRAVRDFSDWSSTYKSSLANSSIPRGKREDAEAKIDAWIEDWMVQLGQGNVAPDKVPEFMKRAEEWLDAKVQREYPPRKPIK